MQVDRGGRDGISSTVPDGSGPVVCGSGVFEQIAARLAEASGMATVFGVTPLSGEVLGDLPTAQATVSRANAVQIRGGRRVRALSRGIGRRAAALRAVQRDFESTDTAVRQALSAVQTRQW